MSYWERRYQEVIAHGAAVVAAQVGEVERLMLEPLWQLAEESLAAYGGAGYGGYWYCRGCGNPQLGEPPWKALSVTDRCAPCGPGDGYARCPVGHEADKSWAGRCNLCQGRGWVEELR